MVTGPTYPSVWGSLSFIVTVDAILPRGPVVYTRLIIHHCSRDPSPPAACAHAIILSCCVRLSRTVLTYALVGFLTICLASVTALPLLVKHRMAKGKVVSDKDMDPFTAFWMNFMTQVRTFTALWMNFMTQVRGARNDMPVVVDSKELSWTDSDVFHHCSLRIVLKERLLDSRCIWPWLVVLKSLTSLSFCAVPRRGDAPGGSAAVVRHGAVL
jgi:hypothetical protein